MSNVKNVQALEKLLGICTGLGGSYNPGNQNLQVKAMTTLLSQVRNVLSEVHSARTSYEIATNQREDAFSTLKPLTTRIISTLLSGGAMPQTVADARTMSRKIFGKTHQSGSSSSSCRRRRKTKDQTQSTRNGL